MRTTIDTSRESPLRSRIFMSAKQRWCFTKPKKDIDMSHYTFCTHIYIYTLFVSNDYAYVILIFEA